MRKYFLSAGICLLLVDSADAQTPIPPTFYGQNYWYTNFNPPNANDLENWGYVTNSGAKLIRVGGQNYNYDATTSKMTRPLNGTVTDPQGYVPIVDHIRSQGCEPMITIPFNGNLTTPGNLDAEAHTAGEIVRVLNIVHKRNVKYFIIANEPGLDYAWYDFLTQTTTHADQIGQYVQAFVVEMRKIDPAIKIIGPELEGDYPTIVARLLSTASPYPLTGVIPSTYNGAPTGGAAGKPWLDYFSHHFYAGYDPGHPITSRADFIEAGYFYSSSSAFALSTSLPPGMKRAVDEVNLKLNSAGDCTANIANCSHYNGSFGDGAIDYFDISTADPNSFLGGQFIVEAMAGMITGDVAISNTWSSREGSAHGYIHKDGNLTTPNYYRKPTYWHYWLMANFFRGALYYNLNVTTGSYDSISNPFRGLKAFAAKSSNYIAVIVMNQAEVPLNFTLDLNNTGTGAGNFRFAMGGPAISGSYPASIDAKSTYLLFFDCGGVYQGVYRLKQSDMAATPLAYTSIPYTPAAAAPAYTPTHVLLTPATAPCLNSNSTSASAIDATGADVTSTSTWYKLPDESNPILPSGLSPGLYKVEFAASGGCGPSSTVFSVHERSPVVNATVSGDCSSAPTLSTLSTPAYPSYSWAPGTGLNTPSAASTGFSSLPATPTAYTVSVTDASGCTISDVAIVSPPGSVDLFMRDHPSDIDPSVDLGIEPNPIPGAMYLSNDIWNRVADDGGVVHENPDYSAAGTDNYLYIKVRNRGCAQSSGGTLKTYWAKAATALMWPNDWTGITYLDPPFNTAVAGNLIATTAIPPIPAAGSTIIKVGWDPPNPATYAAIGNPEPWHFCLLARIEPGITFAETSQIWENTINNNNIIWRNVTVVDNPGNGIVVMGAGNASEVAAPVCLHFKVPAAEMPESFLNDGIVRVSIGEELYRKWLQGGRQASNMVPAQKVTPHVKERPWWRRRLAGRPASSPAVRYEFTVTGSNASLDNIMLDAKERHTVNMMFNYNHQDAGHTKKKFSYDVSQSRCEPSKNAANIVGGVAFDINRPDCQLPHAGADVTIGRNCSTTLTAEPQSDGAVYTWRDGAKGNVIGTGRTITVSPKLTTKYELEVRSTNRCIDYDVVTVTVNPKKACRGVECPIRRWFKRQHRR